MVHIYIDTEFDAVKVKDKFCQMIISFGAVLKYGDQEETFYSLACPQGFQRLTPIVRRMTHLHDADIRRAAPFPVVVQSFLDWLQPYADRDVAMYSFGPDDRRTLLQECERYDMDKDLFAGILDLQKQLSANVIDQGNIVSSVLSLDDLKTAYAIEGAVEHNALTDAHDLMRIHQASLTHTPCPEAVALIVERKRARAQEAARKQQERLTRIMKERFASYEILECDVLLYPEILQQFQLWEERDRCFHVLIREDEVVVDGVSMGKEQLHIHMQVKLHQEVPSLCLQFHSPTKSIEKTYLLHYRNATIVENILKRMVQNGRS